MKSDWAVQQGVGWQLFYLAFRAVGLGNLWIVGICHSCHEVSFYLWDSVIGNSGERLRQIMYGEQICFCSRAAPTSKKGREELVSISSYACSFLLTYSIEDERMGLDKHDEVVNVMRVPELDPL